MIFYPSLDILEGSVVRLKQGDFNEVTSFGNDPLSWIDRFESAGAKNLHLVDLSGARDKDKRQTKVIRDLIKSTKLMVQVGGGIRTESDVKDLIDSGADKVVLGSLAILDPNLVKEMIKKFGKDKFCIALDVQVRNGSGFVMTNGWTDGGTSPMEKVFNYFSDLGVKRFLCTDIAKDGMMEGPNFTLYNQLRKKFPDLEIQASGGVSSLEDLQELIQLGLHSAILGRSLLSEKIPLSKIFS